MATALDEYNSILTKTVGRFGANVKKPLSGVEAKPENPLEDKPKETPKAPTPPAAQEEELPTALQEMEREANTAYGTIRSNAAKVTKLALSLGAVVPNNPQLERAFFKALLPLQKSLGDVEKITKLYAKRNPTVVYPLVVLRGFADTIKALLLGLKQGFARNKGAPEPTVLEEAESPVAQKLRGLLNRVMNTVKQGAADPKDLRAKQEAQRYALMQRDLTNLAKLVRANFHLAIGFAGEDLHTELPKSILDRLHGTVPSIAQALAGMSRGLGAASRGLAAIKGDDLPSSFAILSFGIGSLCRASAKRVMVALTPIKQLAAEVQEQATTQEQQAPAQQEDPFTMDGKSPEQDTEEDPVEEATPVQEGAPKPKTQEDLMAEKVQEAEELRRRRSARVAAYRAGRAARDREIARVTRAA